MISIVLIDDHPIVRQGYRRLLEEQPGFSVIGEEGSGRAGVELVARLRPEIVLLDLTLPDIPGLEVLKRLRAEAPTSRVLVLSMHAAEAYVLEALRHGAAGYVLKSAESTELIRAIQETAAGRRHLSARIDQAVLTDFAARSSRPLDLFDTLTPRERDVLLLAADSLNNTRIGEKLEISPRTVETHRASLMRKLGLKTQTDLVRFALKRGLLPPE